MSSSYSLSDKQLSNQETLELVSRLQYIKTKLEGISGFLSHFIEAFFKFLTLFKSEQQEIKTRLEVAFNNYNEVIDELKDIRKFVNDEANFKLKLKLLSEKLDTIELNLGIVNEKNSFLLGIGNTIIDKLDDYMKKATEYLGMAWNFTKQLLIAGGVAMLVILPVGGIAATGYAAYCAPLVAFQISGVALGGGTIVAGIAKTVEYIKNNTEIIQYVQEFGNSLVKTTLDVMEKVKQSTIVIDAWRLVSEWLVRLNETIKSVREQFKQASNEIKQKLSSNEISLQTERENLITYLEVKIHKIGDNLNKTVLEYNNAKDASGKLFLAFK